MYNKYNVKDEPIQSIGPEKKLIATNLPSSVPSAPVEPTALNSSDSADLKGWLSMAEAASHTPYSSEYLSLLARKNKLPSKKVGNVWYTTRTALESYMQRQMLRTQIQNGTLPTNARVEDLHMEPLRSYKGDVEKYFPQVEKKEESTVHVEKALEKVLDKKLFNLFSAPSAQKQIPESIPGKQNADVVLKSEKKLERESAKAPRSSHLKTVFSSKILVASAIVAIVVFSIAPVPFVFSFFDKSVNFVKDAWKDANTVMGFRPGTHANEILLLDAEGNISIMGHIETEGQLRSYVADGVAPIVVDSTTTVKNLSADSVDNVSAEEFTLAFVTKNGNVTTENVFLEGNVSVGQTLRVKGATKLLSELEVGGDLEVFGEAEFKQAIDVLGPAYFESLVTMAEDLRVKGNLDVQKNISVRGSIEALGTIVGKKGSFGSLSSRGEFRASGDITLGGGDTEFEIDTENLTIDEDGNAVFGGSVSADGFSGNTLSVTNSTTTNATTTNLFAENGIFTNLSVGNQTLNGFIFVNATGTNATTTNFFSENGNFTNLTAGELTIDDLVFGNATGTSATTTNFYSNNISGLIGRISSIIADDVGVGALTAVDAIITNSTTTNATSTNFFASVLDALVARITSLVAEDITTDDLTATNSNFTNATTTNATSTNLYVTSLVSGAASTTNLTFTNATGTSATTTNFFSNIFRSTLATITSLIADDITTGALTATNSNFTNSTTTNATTTSLFSTTASSTNLYSTNFNLGSGTIGSANITNSTIDDLIFTRATGTSATTTNFFSTTASSTNLFSSLLTVGGTGLVVDSSRNTTLGGNLTFATDNTYDIGAPGSARPRTGYFGTSIVAPTATLSASNSIFTGTTNDASAAVLTLKRLSGSEIAVFNNNGTTQFNGSILPWSNNSFDLGASATRWRTGYFGTSVITPSVETTNLLANGSTTLQNFTFVNATGTSATTTNFFSTTASSTNLFSTNFSLGAGSIGTSTITNANITNSTTTNASTTNLSTSGSFYTSLTQGSVPFIGSTGLLTQNNSQLYWDNVTTRLGLGTLAPSAKLHSLATTEQLRLGYDASNYASFTVSSAGKLTVQPTGTDADVEIRTTNFDNALSIDDSTQRVGIGTDVPLNGALYVQGDISLAGSSGIGGSTSRRIGLFGGANTLILSDGNDDVSLGTPTVGNNFLYYKNGVGVGINTSSPGAFALDVNGSQRISGQLTIEKLGGGTEIQMTNGSFYSGSSAFQVLGTAANGLWLGTAVDTPVLAVKSGNVGIGTTSPAYKLSVEGSSTLGNQAIAGYFTATTTTDSVFPRFTFSNATGTSATTTNFYSTNAAFDNVSTDEQDIGNLTFINATGTSATTTNLFTSIFRATLATITSLVASDVTTSALTATNSTTTNATTTNSFATTASSTNLFSSLASIGGNAFNVIAGGNVGIGTTNPGQTLEVYGTSPTALIQSTAGNARSYIFATGGDAFTRYSVSGGNDWSVGIDDSDSDKFKISDNSTLGANDYFTITTAGKVGIGTTNPGVLFQIGSSTPTTAADGLQFGDDNQANLYRSAGNTIRTDGSLIIGTNLTVNGGTTLLSDTDINGTLDVVGAADFDNTVTIAGATQINSTLGATGAATFGSTGSFAGLLTASAGVNTTVITASTASNPGSSVILAQNTNASPSGNLLQLQSGSTPTDKFVVTHAGNTTIAGTLGVTGATSLSTLTTSGAATLNSLGVTNNATVGGTLGVTGNTSLSTLSTSGAATLNSLGVTNNATVGGTLSITGATTAAGITATGLTLNGNASLNGNTTLGDATSDTITFTGRVNSDILPSVNDSYTLGSASLKWAEIHTSNLIADTASIPGTSDNDFVINSDNATADTEDARLIFERGSVTPNAWLKWNATDKEFEFNQNLVAESNFTVTGTTTLSGAATTSSTLGVVGDFSVNTNKFNVAAASGNTTIAGTLGVTGASTFTSTGSFGGLLSALAGITTNALTVSTSTNPAGSVVLVQNTNASPSGNLLELESGSSPADKFVVDASGNTTIAGNLGVTGATSLSTLSTSGAATLNSLGVTNNATVGGTLGVTGATTLSNTLTVNAQTNSRSIIPQSNLAYDLGSSSFYWNNAYINTLNATTANLTTALLGKTTITANTTDYALSVNQQGTGDILNLSDNGTEVLTVLDGGNLGVGTTNPGAKVDVTGNIRASQSVTAKGTGGSGGNSFFWTGAANTGNQIAYLYDAEATQDSANIMRGFYSRLTYNNAGTASEISGLYVRAHAKAAGTITNAYGAYLEQQIQGTNNYTLYSAGGTNYFGGNIGVGTTNPSEKIHVYGTTGGGIRVEQTNTNSIGEFTAGTSNVSVGSRTSTPFLFLMSNAEVARFSTAGNFGIGTTTPPALLSINDPAGKDPFYIGSSTPKLIVKDSGRVGIGTASPARTLHVRSPDGNIARFDSTGTSAAIASFALAGTEYASLGVGDAGQLFTSATENSFGLRAENDLHIGTGGDNIRMTIESGGDIGIGTTNPAQKLHIYNGSAPMLGVNTATQPYYGDSDSVLNIYNQNTHAYALSLQGDGAISWRYPGNGIVTSLVSTANGIMAFGQGTSGATFQVTANGTQGGDGTIPIFAVTNTSGTTTNAPLIVGVDRVVSLGKVGIGTTNPLTALSVEQGSIYANAVQSDTVFSGTVSNSTTHNLIGSDGYWAIRTATNNSFNLDVTTPSALTALTVLQSGNVGISTTTPRSKLHVSGGGVLVDNAQFFQGLDTSGNVENILGVYSDGYTKVLSAQNGIDFQSDSGDTLVRVTDGGNVGIASTSPLYKLSVEGSSSLGNEARAGYFTATTTTDSVFPRFTFTAATGTSATTTNFFSTTASSTNLFSTNYTLGSGTIGSATISSGTITSGTITDLIFTRATGTAATTTNFYTSGQTVLAATSGNVGIGTTNPLSPLSVTKSIGSTTVGGGLGARIETVNGLNTRSELGFSYSGNIGTYTPVVIGYKNTLNSDYTKGDFYIATRDVATDSAPTERLTVTAAGRVGIGTTNPTAAELQVAGSGYFTSGVSAGDVNVTSGIVNAGTGFRIGNTAASNNVLRGNGTNFVSSASAALTKTDDTNVTLTLGGTPTTALLDAVSLTLGWTGQLSVPRGGTGAATFTSNGVLYGNGTGAIQATAEGGANTILTANAGAPAWSASPTIGTSLTTPLIIGGTAADSSLTLRSTSGNGTSDHIKFQVGNNGATEAMRITSAGNIGIGVTNPGSKFVIDKATSTTNVGEAVISRLQAANASNARTEMGFTYSGASGVFTPAVIGYQSTSHTDHTKGNFYIATRDVTTDSAPSERLTITPSGNVGIGSTSAGKKLDVVGNSRITTADTLGVALDIISSDTDDSALRIRAGADNANAISINNAADSATRHRILSGGDAYFAIGAGSVGIGTTNPQTKLDVLGTASSTTYFADSGSSSAPAYSFATSQNTGMWSSSGVLVLNGGGSPVSAFHTNTGLVMNSTNSIGFSSGTPQANTPDVNLYREGAGVLGQRNGANAQTMRVYRTYTDASNYERLAFTANYSGSSFGITTQQGGTGSAQHLIIGTTGAAGLHIRTGDTLRWEVNSSGHLLAGTDNSYDIGSASLRPRNIYAGTTVRAPYFDTTDSGATKRVMTLTSAGSQYGTLQVESNTGTGAWSLGYSSSANNTVGTPVLTWTGSGSVGVGSSTPYARLSVHAGATDTYNGTLFAVASSTAGYATSTHFTILAGGNVGIGTSNPASKLEVLGSAVSDGTLEVDGMFELRDSSSNGMLMGYDTNANASYLRSSRTGVSMRSIGFSTVNGSYNLFVQANTGNVGIGTTTPAAKLDVHATSGTGLKVSYVADGAKALHVQTSSTDGSLYVENTWTSYAGTLAKIISARTDSSAFNLLSLDNATGNKLTVRGDGNVGIGTTNPAQKLEVVGSVQVSGAANSGYVYANAYTKPGFLLNSLSTYGQIQSLTGNVWSLGYGATPTANGTSVLTWNDSGNVGIGTTNPAQKLHVSGSIRATDKFNINDGVENWNIDTSALATLSDLTISNDTTTNLLTLTRTGNVGIGSTAPASKLDVSGAITTSSGADSAPANVGTTDVSGDRIVLYESGAWRAALGMSANGPYIQSSSNGASTYDGLRFFGGASGTASESMRLTNTGNLGIGTTTPGATLHVNKTGSNEVALFTNTGSNPYLTVGTSASAGGFVRWNSSASTIQLGHHSFSGGGGVHVNSSGNVGIGTTGPSSRLHVYDTNRLFSDFPNLAVNTSDAQAIDKGGRIGLGGNADVVIEFASIFGRKENATAGNRAGYLGLATYQSGVGPTEWMRITSTGNVGIGTTNPGTKLDILSGDLRLAGTADTANLGTVIFGTNDAQRYIRGNSAEFQLGTGLSNIRFMGTGANVLSSGAADGTTGLTFKRNTASASGNNFVFDEAGTAQVVIDHAGNVGIGTTTPDTKLTIKGGDSEEFINLTNCSATGCPSQFKISFDGTTGNTLLANPRAGALEFGTQGSERMRITSGGNVGIGTTNPSTKLMVVSTGGGITDTLASVNLTAAAANVGSDIRFEGVGNVGQATIIGAWEGAANTNGYLQFQTRRSGTLTDALRIASTGNVGIGTTNPSSFQLQVAGHVGPNADDTYDLGSSSLRWRDLYLGPTSLHLVSTAGETTSSRDWNLGIQETNGSSEGNFRIREGSTEFFSITPTGNIGIGSTTPTARLSVHAGATDTYKDTIFTVASSTAAYATSTHFTILAGGNVGIGTTNPGYKLHVMSDTSGFGLNIQGSGGVNAWIRQDGSQASSEDWQIGPSAQGYNIYNETDTAYRMVINNDGNVGIGTTNPSTYRLDVHSSNSAQVGRFLNSGNSSYLTVSDDDDNALMGVFDDYGFLDIDGGAFELTFNNGNVGIGTTNPGVKLDVVGGQVRADGSASVGGFVNRLSGTDSGFYGPEATWLGSGTSANLALGAYGASGQIRFFTGGSSTVKGVIDQSGNVGFGTSTPQGRLHVSEGFSGTIPYTGGGTPALVVEDSGITTMQFLTGSDSESRIWFGDSAGVTDGLITYDHVSTAANDIMTFKVGGTADILSIKGTGMVGISTTTPGAYLQISDTDGGSPMLRINNHATADTDAFSGAYGSEFRHSSGGSLLHNMLVYIDENSSARRALDITSLAGTIASFVSNGNVGIGTTNPTGAKLVVDNGANATNALRLISSSKFIDIGALNSTYAHFDTDTAAGFYFYDNITTPSSLIVTGSLSLDGGTNTLDNVTTGTYGTLQVNGGGAGGWEGFSIDGRAVFMHDGGSQTGLYNDVSDEWMLYAAHDGRTELYYNGALKLGTASDGVTITGTGRADTLRSNTDVWTDQNYGHGLVGLYDSTKYQSVFSMGSAYRMPAAGTSLTSGPGGSNFYGIAWTHTNAGGESKSGLSHQALFVNNGVTQTAIGSGIWTNGTITTTASVGLSINGWTMSGGSALTYGSLAINTANGGYYGMNFGNSNSLATLMFDTSGNGGLYNHSGSNWGYYWHEGNNSLGIGGSTTSSSYPLYVNGSAYVSSRLYANDGAHGVRTTGGTETALSVYNSNTATAAYRLINAFSSDGSDSEFIVYGDGQVYSDNGYGGPADVAEWTRVIGDPSSYEPGDLVTFARTSDRKATKAYAEDQELLMGVVTLKPGLVGVSYDLAEDVTNGSTGNRVDMEENYNAKMIATIGYTPVKVSTENGSIKPGDGITISSIPGVGRKANPGETIIGYAFENFDPENGLMGTHEVDLPSIDGTPFRPVTTEITMTDGTEGYKGWIFTYVQLGVEPINKNFAENNEDKRENVSTFEGGLALINSLKVKAFTLVGEAIDRQGFNVEDVASTTPSAIVEGKDGKKFVDYLAFIPALVQSVQDLYAQIVEVKDTMLAWADRFVSRELVATEKLCIGSTCVDENQLITLLNNAGLTASAMTPPSSNNSESGTASSTPGETENGSTASTTEEVIEENEEPIETPEVTEETGTGEGTEEEVVVEETENTEVTQSEETATETEVESAPAPEETTSTTEPQPEA